MQRKTNSKYLLKFIEISRVVNDNNEFELVKLAPDWARRSFYLYIHRGDAEEIDSENQEHLL